MADNELKWGEIGPNTVHLCVDMQRMFAEDTEWHMKWLPRVLPRIKKIVKAHPRETMFTRFIPPARPQDAKGMWQRFYKNWVDMTVSHLGKNMLDVIPSLYKLSAKADIIDKKHYSSWDGTGLHDKLKKQGIDTLVITGGETDVCVLATVLGAVDRGYRVIVVTDALCSSSNKTHDAMLHLYRDRFDIQIETADTATLLKAWPDPHKSIKPVRRKLMLF